MNYDCIYWFDPDNGRHGTIDQFRGSWNRVLCKSDQVEAMITQYNQRGFIAKRGRRSIGPPSTPPEGSRFIKC